MVNAAQTESPSALRVIECAGVTVRKGDRDVVRAVDWTVTSDQRWVVLGPNGAGKSSLLDVVAARAHPAAGEVRVLQEQLGLTDVFTLRPRIGMVGPASTKLIPHHEEVSNVVLTASWGVTGRWRESYQRVDLERAARLLATLGVGHLAGRQFGTLSDGESKRVLVARALMPDPEILVLDEPTAGLDLGAREDLVERLSHLAADPAAPAIVLVTHHVEEIPPNFTHAMLLAAGEVVASGPLPEVIRGGPLSATFGVPLTVGRFGQRFFATVVR